MPSPVMLRIHRAGAEPSERPCALFAGTLEGTGVVMTVIAVLAVITGIPRFDRNEEGRMEKRSCPKKPTTNEPHSGEGKSQRAKSLGMKWNETAFWKVCKLLKTWWPGTESVPLLPLPARNLLFFRPTRSSRPARSATLWHKSGTNSPSG